MHIRRLQFTTFRNYQHLNLDLPNGRLLFLGDNAQGKSNLLEAVHLLASGRSSRAGSDAEMIGWTQQAEATQPFARLGTAVERQDGDVQLELVVAGQSSQQLGPAQRAGKRYRVNGIPRRAVDFVGQLRAVLFTADDLEIISGSPSVRRAYLDAALAQLDRAYYMAQQRYTRIMQQRNATLRRIREGMAAQDELFLWDDNFSREGATIIAARQRAIQALSESSVDYHRQLAGGVDETLSLTYEPALGDDFKRMLQPGATNEAVQKLFATALAAQRRREIGAGVSLVGPHRDDVSVLLNGVSAASFGSRAQIRTAALALRLAEARMLMAGGTDTPVLLLDDIVSELDGRRRASVLAGLEGFEQVWFTATTESWLPEDFVRDCAAVFTVSGGQVTPA
ncbi:MAG: DNA replication/repair protein RecF [Dehalococcoidia bacterium]